MTASGVRSSWLMSASSVRRWLLVGLEAPAIVSNPSVSSPTTGTRRIGRGRDPDRVVAGLDPARRLDEPVERPRGQAQRRARSRPARPRRPGPRDDARDRPEPRQRRSPMTATSEPTTIRNRSPNRQPNPRWRSSGAGRRSTAGRLRIRRGSRAAVAGPRPRRARRRLRGPRAGGPASSAAWRPRGVVPRPRPRTSVIRRRPGRRRSGTRRRRPSARIAAGADRARACAGGS